MEEIETVELEFQPPSRKAKGFLRRMKKAMRLQALSKSEDMTPENVDDMVNFLVDYVVNEFDGMSKEETVEARKEILWDLNQDQFNQLMTLVAQGADEEEA